MNSARHLLRRMVTGTTTLRNLRYGSNSLHRLLASSGDHPAQKINKFTPVICVRMKSAQARNKFEVINVQDEEDFKKRVLEASCSVPVIVDFHATWCGPCKLLGPRLESIIAEEEGKVVMAKVDIDDNADLAMEYGVRSVPMVMAVKNGKVRDQFVGLIDDDQIRNFVCKVAIS